MNASVAEKLNILMVDDQPAKLLSYEAILGDLGENLLKAASAREAFEHLLRIDIAVLLVDVCMPELDGFEFAAMLREHPRFEHVAIIFVSAVQITELDRLRGYAAGAVDYVPVPVVPEVLRAKVRVFAELKRKTRQLEQLNEELERRVAERTAELAQAALELRGLNEDLEQRIEARTREREQALAQLFEAQKVDTIGRLTGGVAHDFNNLLMAVLGSLELLRKRLPDDARMQRLLDNAVEGARRGATLTSRLLAFARRQELKFELIDLSKLAGGMEDLLARALGPGVRMAWEIPRDLSLLRADANQLELALLNIAVNARDAMPSGGTFAVTARNATAAAGEIAGLAAGHYVRISLTDTGQGMDETTLSKAMEPFFTTKGPGKGTGLGLSSVHGLAVQSEGAIKIASQLGVGTTIDLWLPALPGNTEEPPQPAPAVEGGTVPIGSLTVLIVDDDPLVGEGTAAMLEELGHVTIQAASGEQALDIVQTCKTIDLVITDHVMPGMTGGELIRRIGASHPHLPMLLASGFLELAGDLAPGLGCERIGKPFGLQELEQSIARSLGRAARKPSTTPGTALARSFELGSGLAD